ncbi:hypothetical protein GUITHDRAFT_100538 [Guillardia theta CCMP2712]|uniref:CRAL-TRIO domain-containing protein n=1 Tax=Guillardia theta (strain CCMP2712) TaxID=905079 RepID=L1JY92_GUITC|nr:hypothetical protein GUITHDRAFT_100538 [Guillardia theta CCMP2712]EKX53551.1 hypothetical protein GUITHDRAFT_100538 [Guillardia theta CCMP2712]|eukprot:XP_005840531.1 hypothetical protein GUITHDRAFT_100538 [Guillardia theta CCMP2712]
MHQRQDVDALLSNYRSQIEFLQQKVSDILPKTKEFDEIFILRYVLSYVDREGLTAAEKAIRERIKFRKENDACIQEIISTKVMPNVEKLDEFKISHIGDLDGKEPLIYFRIGHFNSKGIMNIYTHEQVVNYISLGREFLFQLCDARTRQTRKLIKIIAILDFDNFSIFRRDGRFAKAAGEASKYSSLIHPQLLGRVLIMNAPRYMRVVMNAFSFFMSKNFVEKIVICPSHQGLTPSMTASTCPFLRSAAGPDAWKLLPTELGGLVESEGTKSSSSQSDMVKIKVNARSKEQLHIDIPCNGLRAAWEVMRYPSCGMREVKEEALEGGPPLCVMEMTKLKAENGSASGTMELPVRGELVVSFDNTHSKLRSKSIDYRIEVDPVFDDVF